MAVLRAAVALCLAAIALGTAGTARAQAPATAPAPVLAPAPAPAAASPAVPLPLPELAATVCTGATFREAVSQAPSCSKTLFHYEPIDAACCKVLGEYYGVDSTRPSRNCFCYEPYWTRLLELEETTYLSLGSNLASCAALTNDTIAYYQLGAGPCAGLPEAAVPAAVVNQARSLGQWVRDLSGNGIMAWSFAAGLISSVGFVAMLWPFVLDSVIEINKRLVKRHRS